MSSIFTTETPTTTPGDSQVCVGLVFTVDSTVTCTGGRYYTAASISGVYDNQVIQMGLWNGAGTLIASGSRTQLVGDTHDAWITVNWATSVSLTTGNTYTVGYLTPGGTGYSVASGGLTTGITNSPFGTPASAGRYTYGSTLAQPVTSSTANFFADVVGTAGGGGGGAASLAWAYTVVTS